jgi:hypothetical protein
MLPRLLGDKMMVLDLIKRDIQVQVCDAIQSGKTLILDNISEPLPLFVVQLIKPKIITNPASHEKVSLHVRPNKTCMSSIFK